MARQSVPNREHQRVRVYPTLFLPVYIGQSWHNSPAIPSNKMKSTFLLCALSLVHAYPAPTLNETRIDSIEHDPYMNFQATMAFAEDAQKSLNNQLKQAADENCLSDELLAQYAANCDALLANVSDSMFMLYNSPPEAANAAAAILFAPFCANVAVGAQTVVDNLHRLNGTVSAKTQAQLAANYERTASLANAVHTNATDLQNLQVKLDSSTGGNPVLTVLSANITDSNDSDDTELIDLNSYIVKTCDNIRSTIVNLESVITKGHVHAKHTTATGTAHASPTSAGNTFGSSDDDQTRAKLSQAISELHDETGTLATHVQNLLSAGSVGPAAFDVATAAIGTCSKVVCSTVSKLSSSVASGAIDCSADTVKLLSSTLHQLHSLGKKLNVQDSTLKLIEDTNEQWMLQFSK